MTTLHSQANNIFGSAISTDRPNSMFQQKGGEVSVPRNTSNSSPLQTNGFYSNSLIEDQDQGVWTHPYSVANVKDTYYGLGVYHGEIGDITYGDGNPASHFYYPTGVHSLILSASELGSDAAFSLVNMSKFAATARFKASDTRYLDCPLVQGMGFVTGIYKDSTPKLCSTVGFTSINGDTAPKSGIQKYKIVLKNNSTWVLYVTVPNGQSLRLSLKDDNNIISSNSVDGAVFQVAYGTDGSYDRAAGCYPTNGSISASVSDSKCTYKISYTTKGSSNNGTTLMFALPHHTDSFTSATSRTKTSFELQTTVKGKATACLTNSFEMEESIPTGMGFDPYTTISNKKANYSSNAKSAISSAAGDEYNNDVQSYSDVDSMYTSGKILAKYALVLYVLHFILKDSDKTQTLLSKMKDSISRFTSNKQQNPLFYDTNFKGIVSSATDNNDYGNGHYNDHHFHWGYHVHAAAVVAKVDSDLGGNWKNDVKEWVNTLIRDSANPSTDDKYFPVSRNFDFYNGHSWARGLFASGDGKDEESTSEDYNFAYAVKSWGNVIGDSNMENRGNLMLAILKRSLGIYCLMQDNNKVEPSRYIGNKVPGITFENKMDFTTYFGTNTEYIHGIQMLPITPASSYIRSPTFVKQEWDEKLSSIINNVNDGWKGILMLNVALYDPDTAYNFFSGNSFSTDYLDNGMSKTWSLAYCAGVGASS